MNKTTHDVADTVELTTGPGPVGSVIWLHGLGADGNDFVPLVPELVQPGERALRFIFPHAPVRPVTLNNGYEMRAWYDIVGIDRQSRQDEAGIRDSDARIRALIAREVERGIPTQKIVLAGFSQGGAMATFTGPRLNEKLAGIIGLSCYPVLAATFGVERTAVNGTTPVLLAHGSFDPMVDPRLGEELRRMLSDAGYPVQWHTYPMPHAVCPEEIVDIRNWLRRVL